MTGARRIIWIAIWTAIVVGGCAMHKPQPLEILGVAVALLALVLGGLKGPKAILTAAAAIALVTGVLALATRGDRRDPLLPACVGLLDGGSYYQYDRECFESSSDQALRGVVPAALVLLFGLTTGGFRFAADYGDREFRRRWEKSLDAQGGPRGSRRDL